MMKIPLPKDRRKVGWLMIGALIIISSLVTDLRQFNKPPTSSSPFDALPGESETFSEKHLEGKGDDKIVVLHLEGIIQETVSSTNALTSSNGVNIPRLGRQIDQAANDDSVKALILVVNSPGGTAAASQTIHEKLVQAKSKGKKVVILMRETAASGGYYIAAAGDKIVANSSTLTGSIGVIFQMANLEELYKKIGYQPITLKAGKYKDIGSSDRPMTDEERVILQKILDTEYNEFVQAVATGRHIDKAKALSLAEGRIYTGAQAKEAGLVDELGNMPKAIEVAKSLSNISDARVVEYSSLSLDFLTSFLGGGFGGMNVLSLLNRIEQPQPSGVLYLWQPE
jgi:protease-4